MKTLINIVVLLFLFSFQAYSQKLDIVKIEYSFFPGAKFKTPPVPSLNDVEIQINEFNLMVNYPVVISEQKTFLINTISFGMLNFSFDNVPSSFNYLGSEKLYSLSYSLTLLHNFDKKWLFNLSLKPTLASDFENIDSHHYKFQAACIVNYNFTENFQGGVGAAYNTDFGKPMVLPLLKFNYANGKDFFINIILPKFIDITYSLNNNFEVGLLGKVQGNQYRIGKDSSPAKGNSLKYSAISTGPFIKAKVSNKLNLLVHSGLVLNRIYESFDPDNNELRNADLDQSLFVSGGISLGL